MNSTKLYNADRVPDSEIFEAEPSDIHVGTTAFDFSAYLRQHGISFKYSGTELTADRDLVRKYTRTESREEAVQENERSVVSNSPQPFSGEWLKGCVYPAYSATGRPYIIKVSPGGGLETSLLLQAKSISEKCSEDVFLPQLYDYMYSHAAGVNMLVLEYYERGTLADLIKTLSPVPMHRQHISRIMVGVATAVHFLHLQNIAHWSIRASNILVDDNLNGRLCGLGTTWKVDSKKKMKPTQWSVYKAPEADRDDAEPLPQDMFAVGIVLYRCVTGSIPKRVNGVIDYHGIKSNLHVPLDPDIWKTTQLLLSDKLNLRPSSGQFLHTDWITQSKNEKIKQLLCVDD